MNYKTINPNKVVKDFIHEHTLILGPLIKNETVAIYWSRITNICIKEDLRSRSIELNESMEMTWGILLSMLDRIFEYTEGAIVAFVSGSPAASEIISRTAVESSVSLQYILRKDRQERLSHYLYSYIEKEQKEIRQWLRTADTLSPEEARIHRDAALKKKSAMDEIRKLLDHSGLPILQSASWPNVAERFKDIGIENSYRTVYAALSSQIHSDAEDTLNYFFAIASGDKNIAEKMGIETVNFSRFLMYYAITFYMQAALAYTTVFSLSNAQQIIRDGLSIIGKLQSQIGSNKNNFSKFR